MLDGFTQARSVEERSMAILRPFIRQRSYQGQYVTTSKGPLARELQKTVGDVLYNADAEHVYSIEIKAEETNQHGNFFLETWNNRKWFTPGWMVTLKADVLLYHFIAEDELYVIPFNKLRQWAFGVGRNDGQIYQFPEKPQGKYDQLNDTWGRCVPVEVVTAALQLKQPYAPHVEALNWYGGELQP